MKKLFFSLMALCLAAGANAATEITSGTSYYIQNVESGLYMGGANNWGTRGSVSVDGEMFTATLVSDGVYTLKDVAITSGYLGSNIYTDNGTAQNWTITAVDGEDGVFTISNGTNYLAQSTEAGGIIGYVISTATEVTSAAKWYFLTKEEAIAKLDAATKTAPVDATFLIGDANFSRNHTNTAWTQTKGSFNLAGGATDNLCAEAWRNAFDLNQTITVPNGVYELTAQAALTDYTGAYDGADYPYLYANSESAVFNNMEESDRGTNMTTLSNAFTKGSYAVGPVKVTVTDGTLKIGVKGTRTDTWCIWDNFQLKYYGVDLTALKENLEARIAVAQALGKMNATVQSNLDDAVAAAQSCEETQAALEAATTTLNNAISAAEASVAIYTSIAAVNAKVSENLTTSGQEAYASTLAAYNDGTLETVAQAEEAYRAATLGQTEDGANFTGAIINPDFETGDITGWTDTYTAGNHGFQNNNSYSNEGASCKNFMECWIWKPNSLADGKLSQVLTNLPAGNYTMSADLISVQQSGDIAKEDQTGVYVFATCAAGTFKSEACSTANGLPETFSFTFNTTAGDCELGLMTKSTNCNWVAFDNVQLIRNGASTVNVYQEALKEVFAVATDPETVAANACAADVLDAYVSAYAEAKEKTECKASAYTDEDYLAANKALTAAEEALQASIAEYATSKAMRDAIAAGTNTITLADGVNDWIYTSDSEDCAFHTNTWSNEGESDNTEMIIPFGENWNGNGNLADATIDHSTIVHMPAGNYAVSMLVRYYSEKGADVEGITFEDQDLSLLTECTVGNNKGQYGVVTSIIEVGEDGNLDFGFEIEGATGNWLAWKGLTIKYLGDEEYDTSVTLQVTDAKYGTFFAPFAVDGRGITAYTVDSADEDGVLTLTEVVGMIPANTPVVVAADEADENTIDGVAYSTIQGFTRGMLTGVLKPTEITDGYVLQNQDKVGFYKVDGTKTVPANRCYLTADSEVKAFFFGNETAIQAVEALTSSDAKIYDLNGRQLQKLQKGVNIVNGHKVIVK